MGEDAYTCIIYLSIRHSEVKELARKWSQKLQEQFPEKECQSTDIDRSFLKRCTEQDEEGADD